MTKGPLGSLGADLASAQDTIVKGSDARARARRRLLAGPSSPSRRAWSTYRRRGVYGAALAAAAAAAAFFAWPTADELRFSVDGEPSEEGRWVAASGRPHTIAFSDETTFVLSPNSSARVLEARERHARVAIERGAADVSVTPGLDRQWHVLVGPFEVQVVGTVFAVQWSPDAERFEVTLRRGEVAVHGPLLGPEGRHVHEGETLAVWLDEERVIFTEDEDVPAPNETTSHVPPTPTEPGAATGIESDVGDGALARPPPDTGMQVARSRPTTASSPTSASASERAGRVDPRSPSWQALARRGDYAEAIEAADIETVLAEGSSRDLLRLGDAARLARSTALAERVYEATRRRFTGTDAAAQGAFALGRLAADQQGDPRRAARWFETYLEEAPGGDLRQEAAGRRIDAERRAGQRGAARAAARMYLREHPDGPYRELAESILQTTTSQDDARGD